ncbi:MAG: PAS domain S-box protein [Desulfobacterales bacterium]
MNEKASYDELVQRIRELEHAEEERDRSLSQLRTTLDATDDGILVVDTGGKIVLHSNRFAEMWRLPESILNSRGDDRALAFVLDQLKDPQGFLTKVNKLYADPIAKSFDTVEFKDGRIFERYSRPHMLNDEVIGRVWSFRDVTARIRAEEELRQSESQLRTVLETMELIAVSLDNQGNISFCNDYLLNLTGWKRKEVLGKNWFMTFLPPEISGEIKQSVFLKAIRTGKFPAHYQNDIVTKEKARRLINWNNTIVLDSQGNILGITSIGEDITERKQAEEALRKSEETLKSIFRAAPIGIGLVSARVIKQANDRLCEMVGYSRDELLGQSARILYPTDKEFEYVGREKYALITKFGTGTVETFWKRKDGRLLNVLLSSTPIDPDDCSRGVTFAALDITSRKQAERALRENEEKYRDLVENINDVIYVVSTEGIITYVSPVIEAQTGYRQSEVISKRFSEFVYHEDLPFVMDQFQKILSGDIVPSQYRLVKKSGEILWIRSSSRPVFKGDNIIGFRGSFVDITHSKHMEEQLRQAQKMEAIGTLTGGIAHDVNNILGIILGNIELALDDVPEWNAARLNLEEIRIASLRAKDVIRQLLSFARKTKLEKKPTNIIPIVKESLKLLRSSIPTSIDIRQNIPEAVDTILADPTQINQVLINLCTNADHAMPDGGVMTVTLKNIELDEKSAVKFSDLTPGRYVNLTVADTGHGIPQEDIDRIFDPYFTTKEVGRGTGMGLAVVHGIVKGHNGSITVKSELGRGTTFSISFPVVERKPISEIAIDEDLPSGKERIFFVDDEESIVKVSCQRLERLGYKVESTTNPLEALDLFRSKANQFDLVISDLTMPKMTGDKLIKEILNIRPDTPIIICTGFSEKMDIKKAKEIGASGYLEKPHEKRDLAKMVRKVLDGK